jgi:hypothetical protein
MAMMLSRLLLIVLFVSALSLDGCGLKGDRDVEIEHGDSIGKGPGLLTGKRGGVIIYQR